jgi:hypothetical protein
MTEKRKPGRPPGSLGKNNLSDPRRHHFTIALSNAELAELKQKAAAVGQRVRVYARKMALR